MLEAIIALPTIIGILISELLENVAISTDGGDRWSAQELGPSKSQFTTHLTRIRLCSDTAQGPSPIAEPDTTFQRHVNMTTSAAKLTQALHLRNVSEKAGALPMKRIIKSLSLLRHDRAETELALIKRDNEEIRV